MKPELWWWIAAAVAVAAELATGTFYLLMVALGLASGGIAAALGGGTVSQLLGAALVGGGAAAAWTAWRERHATAASADASLQLDLGHPIEVSAWAADGSARAHYRGSDWAVRWEGTPSEPPPGPGHYVIRGRRGNELIVGR